MGENRREQKAWRGNLRDLGRGSGTLLSADCVHRAKAGRSRWHCSIGISCWVPSFVWLAVPSGAKVEFCVASYRPGVEP